MSAPIPTVIRQRGDRWFIESRQFGTMFSRTGYATREDAERVDSAYSGTHYHDAPAPIPFGAGCPACDRWATR